MLAGCKYLHMSVADLTPLQLFFIVMLFLFNVGWILWGYRIWQRSRLDEG